jgi:two-component system chemotaxis sensor kinase CheA
MNIEEIQEIFLQECDEGLVQAEEGLLALQNGVATDDTINTIFRAVHSIKGGAGAFSFTALQGFTHQFETLLDRVRSGEMAIGADLVATLLRAFDMLADHVVAIRGGGVIPDDAAIMAELTQLCEQPAEAPAAPAIVPESPVAVSVDAFEIDLDDMIALLDTDAGDTAETVPASVEADDLRLDVSFLPAAMGNGGEPLLLIRELVHLGGTVSDIGAGAVPTLDQFDAGKCYLTFAVELPAGITQGQATEIFEFLGDDCVLSFSSASTCAPAVEVALPAAMTPVCEEAAPQTIAQPAPVPSIVPAPAPAPAPASVPAPALAAVPARATAPEGAAEEKAATGAGGMTPTIRVDLEKLDRLVNLVGELVITQAMLAQRLADAELSQITELADLYHLTRELQDSAMAIRAQPIQSVFGRVPRIVREVQASTGKKVRLEVEGETTELDKTVVERIGEPLTHLIRNAVDHGLEDPETRIAAGKPAEGVIRLSAEHRSGRILISVSDDGAGINREKVLAKAVERGIVGADQRLTDEEIDNLIFAPGFSTATTVSNISGRGVGMDVVRRNVQALGGRIAITSTPGQGSSFTMSLPLTLAILDGMIVSVGDQTFVIPLNHIVESLRPTPQMIQRMGARRAMINVRGSWLRVRSIADDLSVRGAVGDPTEGVLIVVEGQDGTQGVLLVDAIVDQRQVVIKSLETNFGPVDGVSGATILGDGHLALILDVEAALTRNGPADMGIAA